MFETRAIITSIAKARAKIEEFHAEYQGYYCFTDTIYVPTGKAYDLSKEFLRLRVYAENNWKTKSVILLNKQHDPASMKRKTVLKKEFDNAKDASDFIKNKMDHYHPAFSYEREGWQYSLHGMKVYIEDVKQYKPMVEVEGEDEGAIQTFLETLGIEQILKQPLPEFMKKVLEAEKSHLL